MKVLKAIFLVLIVLCMIITSEIMMVHFALQKTVLSDDFFQNAYDQSELGDAVSDILNESMQKINVSGMSGEAMQSIVASNAIEIDLLKHIDEDWIVDETENLLIGTHSYLTGQARELPSMDIEPMKDMIEEVIGEQIDKLLEQGDFQLALEFILTAYNLLATTDDGTVDEAVISQLVGDPQANQIGFDLMKFIVEENMKLDQSLSSSDRFEIIFNLYIKSMIKIDDISDELDLDKIINDAFPDGNPMEAVRTIILAFKDTLFWALGVVLLLLLLIVIFTAFKPAQIFGWLSAPLIATGLFGLFAGLALKFIPAFANYAGELDFSDVGAGAQQIIEFVQVYVDGFGIYLIVPGAILLVCGVAFAVTAGILASSRRKSGLPDEPSPGWLIALRVILVVVLLISIVVANAYYFAKIYDDVEDAVITIEEAADNMEPDAFINAFTDNLNIPFNLPDSGE